MAIRKLVTDEQFRYWPLSSIFHHGRRQLVMNTGLSTFYRYVRLLGIRRLRYRKPPPTQGIRADRPHGIWHTDVTILKMGEKRFYLHLLMDNFSRYVLNWKLEETLRGLTVTDMLTEALASYRPAGVWLMVDGGPENNNSEVETLIAESDGTVRKLIAQKDIDFSNSMVESVNHRIKNSYLRPMGINDPSRLREVIASVIHDINHVRPHNAIGGLIPVEALNGIAIDATERRQQLLKARAERMEYNRRNTCGECL
jgi:putative transposase